jgi:hypothetical protein
MKRKIQIESGPKTPDRRNRKSHFDDPCPIHENPKNTSRQCRVLKNLRRPLTAAHRRQINREPSPNRLVFQIARTTISPNYPGEVFETTDHEVLVVSTDIPPQDRETDEQRVERKNANTARVVRRQQELAVAAPGVEQPPGNIGMQAPAAPAAPQPQPPARQRPPEVL